MIKTIITLWMLIAFISGGVLDNYTTAPTHVTHTVTKQIPIYLPVRHNRHFDQQRDLIAAVIPISLLKKKGH